MSKVSTLDSIQLLLMNLCLLRREISGFHIMMLSLQSLHTIKEMMLILMPKLTVAMNQSGKPILVLLDLIISIQLLMLHHWPHLSLKRTRESIQ